ncbi:hypothetical protein ACTHPF_15890 [Paenibacillus sp. SAF-054]|uniref:hypothetical protein n=1 Tax=unclassified Paenibacillus TaxID=185978 RepID=UPI003F7D386E
MKKLQTVRAAYLYICMGSALLSGVALFAVYQTFVFLYAHTSPDSFFARLTHGLVNHIGRTPIAIFVFGFVFAGLFMLRSRKIAEDMKSLLKGAAELAETGTLQPMEIASGGELKALAGYLRSIPQAGAGQTSFGKVDDKEPAAPMEDEELMALLLRTKTLLRMLEAAEPGHHPITPGHASLEAVKREALGLERFLESLMAAS